MRQVRTIRYRDIAADLRRRVEEGEFAAGRLLPSESELSATYSASRVTIRKALEDLRAEGLVDSRQGFGWFVAGSTVRQPLAHLGHHRGPAGGRGPGVRAPDPRLRVRPAAGRVRAAARRRQGAEGHPGQPGRRRAVRPGHRLVPRGARRRAEPGPGRATARSTSCCRSRSAAPPRPSGPTPPAPTDAELLQVPVGSPVLVCERVTADAGRHAGADRRVRVPRPPHRVHRGPGPPRGVDRPRWPPAGRVARARLVPCADAPPLNPPSSAGQRFLDRRRARRRQHRQRPQAAVAARPGQRPDASSRGGSPPSCRSHVIAWQALATAAVRAPGRAPLGEGLARPRPHRRLVVHA